MKKIVLIDMDGVLVDLQSEINNFFKENPHEFLKYKNSPDLIPNLFKNPKPIKDAIESVIKLTEKYDVFIATASPWKNEEAVTHKIKWLKKYFGDLFYKKVFITHRKDMLVGDYLIDDRLANGAKEFRGELLRFGYDIDNNRENKFKNWNEILNYLL